MDALSALISMLRPRDVFAKVVTGKGNWGASFGRVETVGFGLVLAGECFVSSGGPFVRLQEGDFVLVQPTSHFSICSDPEAPMRPVVPHQAGDRSVARHFGDIHGTPDFELLGGYFWFDPAHAAMVPHLLPQMVCVRNADVAAQRLLATIQLLSGEANHERPGRELIVGRLVEVILVEAFRLLSEDARLDPLTGLLGGLADTHLASALHCIHTNVGRPWTVAELARHAGLSRSAFCDRFRRKVGMPPMEYLRQWRFALAKDMLRGDEASLEKMATRLGYHSASAFSTAFTREVGLPPSQFARGIAA